MTAGDMTKLSLVYIRDKLLEAGIRPTYDAKVKIVSVVHDESSIEAPEEEAETYAKIQSDAMREAADSLTDHLQIPIDQKIRDYWTH